MRLGQVVGVGGSAVAEDFRDHPRAPGLGRGGGFHDHEARAFAKCQPVARRVERAGDARRTERLQGIEPAKNQLAQRIIATGEHALGPPRADEMKRLADRVRPRGTGIRHDPDRAAHPELAGQVSHLALRLIEFDPPQLVAAVRRGREGLFEILFTDGHRRGGGAHDRGDFTA